jgi:hypothetical protein
MITAICGAVAGVAGAVTAIVLAVRRSKKRKALDAASARRAIEKSGIAAEDVTNVMKASKR